jgi:hypothetical protein
MNCTRSRVGMSPGLSTPKINCGEGSALAPPTAAVAPNSEAAAARPRKRFLIGIFPMML